MAKHAGSFHQSDRRNRYDQVVLSCFYDLLRRRSHRGKRKLVHRFDPPRSIAGLPRLDSHFVRKRGAQLLVADLVLEVRYVGSSSLRVLSGAVRNAR